MTMMGVRSLKINHFVRPFKIELEGDEFTPSSLIVEVNEKLSADDAAEIIIKGICKGIKNQDSYNFYYGHLFDPNDLKSNINIRVPKNLKFKIIPNVLCTMRGLLKKQISNRIDGDISIIFEVSEVIDTEICEQIDKTIKEQNNIISRKIKRGFIDVEKSILSAIRQKNKAHILIITGEKSVAYNDVIHGIRYAMRYYKIEEKRVNFGSIEQICDALNSADESENFDVISIVRGGGDGLDIFSNIEILKSAASIKSSCLVTAIGHSDDKPIIEKIADHPCKTPTDFGNYLGRIGNIIQKETFLSSKNGKKDIQESSSNENKLNDLAWKIAAISTTGFIFMVILYFRN